MIRRHAFNREMSIKMAQAHRKKLAHKMCYNNIFNMISNYPAEFHGGKWKIAYGYLQATRNFYCRHCFIVDENGKAIDPTVVHINRTRDDHDHISFKLMQVDEYLNTLWKHNGEPALFRAFMRAEREMFTWSLNEGIVLMG